AFAARAARSRPEPAPARASAPRGRQPMRRAPRARAPRRIAAAAFLLAAPLVGCSSILDPRPDLTRYFVLTSAPTSSTQSPPSQAALPSLGVGPVSLPGYLERPEMVHRTALHEIVPSRLERWAEPLEAATLRVLVEDLAHLSASPVVRYPWLPP